MSVVREFSLTSPSRRRVGNPDELNNLYERNRNFENLSPNLMTVDNRRQGIQCLQLDLLRKYQTAFKYGTLPYEEERRKLFESQLDGISAAEDAFCNRFVKSKPEPVASNQPVHVFPLRQEQGRLHGVLECICRKN